ncbi:MAG: NAD-dependent deacetylase [Sandaracinaceae bacterium]
MNERLAALLDEARAASGPVVFLTGAGISAESGIPTFRGEEGYWTVGSTHYRPMELATQAAFRRMPEDVWSWYLYRRSVCRAAEPNFAHTALVRLEEALKARFLLVTQNVDGLHLRAGNSLERTYEIHGNIDYLRCGGAPRPIPHEVNEAWSKETRFDDATRALLSCCEGGTLSRPHVLWFDEYYDEALFRFESSLEAAMRASLLVVVGTSGSTNLPMQMGAIVARRGAPMVVVNRDPSPFSAFAEQNSQGVFLQGTAGEHVPAIVDTLLLG